MRPILACLIVLPLFAQETVLLRPGVKPDASAPTEKTEERGTAVLHDRAVSNVVEPSITVYLPRKEDATGIGVVICPGGGYMRLAIDKEGHDVARWLNSFGVAGFVLKYRLPGSMRGTLGDLKQAAESAQVAIEDAQDAMHLVRANASRWNLRPGAIGMMGFSAGGHLTAMMGMIAAPGTRPDFLALIYPAIPKGIDVSAVPRTFIVHADDDPTVSPAENSVRFYLALKQAKIPAEMLIYSTGGHGFGIRKNEKTASGWPDQFARWLVSNYQ
jgi:acetyl esterase/lipase